MFKSHGKIRPHSFTKALDMDEYQTPMVVRLMLCFVLFVIIVGTHYLAIWAGLHKWSETAIKTQQDNHVAAVGSLTTWKIISDFFAGGKIQTVWLGVYLMWWYDTLEVHVLAMNLGLQVFFFTCLRLIHHTPYISETAGIGTGWPYDCNISMNDPDSHAVMAMFFGFYIFFRHISPVSNFEEQFAHRDQEQSPMLGEVPRQKPRQPFGTGVRILAFIVFLGGQFLVGFSRFVLGAAGAEAIIYGWLIGAWLLLISMWCIDPSLRTFIAKLKVRQLTDEERSSAKNCIIIWNVVAFLILFAIFITVDNLGVFDIANLKDPKKCSLAAATANDSAWRNILLGGMIMLGFGSIYGAMYFHNPAN